MGAYAPGRREYRAARRGQPGSEQREAEQAERQAGREHDSDGADEGARPRDADGPDRPQPVDHTVAHESDRRHGHGERRDNVLCDTPRPAELVADVERRPVGTGLLAEDSAQADEPDQEDGPGREREVRRRRLVGRRRVLDQQLRDCAADRGEDERLDRELNRVSMPAWDAKAETADSTRRPALQKPCRLDIPTGRTASPLGALRFPRHVRESRDRDQTSRVASIVSSDVGNAGRARHPPQATIVAETDGRSTKR